jgi:hypothetical protein
MMIGCSIIGLQGLAERFWVALSFGVALDHIHEIALVVRKELHELVDVDLKGKSDIVLRISGLLR